jgi:hypothetical protein
MAPPKKQPESDPMLAVWFAVGLLFALFVGTGAGILGWVSGQGVAAAVTGRPAMLEPAEQLV